MSHHLPIIFNNIVPLGNMTNSKAIIKKVMDMSHCQHTDYVDAIIAAHKLYTKHPNSIDLINNILKKEKVFQIINEMIVIEEMNNNKRVVEVFFSIFF